MKTLKFGCSILSWILPNWNKSSIEYAINESAKSGFDLIEILFPPSMDSDTKHLRTHLRENNLDAIGSFNLPKDAAIVANPAKAKELIKSAIQKTSEIDSRLLVGVLHSGIGYFSGSPLTEDELSIIVDCWTELSEFSKGFGVDIAIEPINRYETYVCNTAKNVLEILNKIPESDNLFIHLDTFHMNIEENNFEQPVLISDKKLRHLHMTESHRGMLGEGTVNWEELFQALKKIKFSGNLVLENFTSQVDGMQSAVSLWQTSKYSASDLAKGSLNFMKKMAKKHNLI